MNFVDVNTENYEIFMTKNMELCKGLETMTENKNVPMTKMLNFQRVRFDHFVIWYSNLFRISDLDIRILPEHDFSFRHYLRGGIAVNKVVIKQWLSRKRTLCRG